MKLKMVLMGTLLLAASLSLTAAPKAVSIKVNKKGDFANWQNRGAKGDFTPLVKDGKTFIKINGPKKVVNVMNNDKFALKTPLQIRLTGKFTGKGNVQLGFHSYSKKGVYTGTFPGKRHIFKEAKDVTITNLVTFGEYGDVTTGEDEKPFNGYVCVYARPGTVGVISDITYEVLPFTPDQTSLIAIERKNAPKKLTLQHRLVMPDEIYAVEGVEMNVYFDNVFLTVNPDNYVFDVSCSKGHNFKRRWSFTPGKRDIGTHKWTLQVISDAGLVAKKTLNLHVVPANAGKGKNLSLLMLGDSIIDVTTYPRQVHKLFQGPNNPKLTMVGERGSAEEKARGMRHQGHAGWAFATFLAKGPLGYADKTGKFILDIPAYFKKNNGGKAPDVIAIQLGCNDVFGSTDFYLPGTLARISGEMDTLIGAFRKAAPNSHIVLCLITPCANSDGIGRVYRNNQTKYQYTKNRFMLNNMIMKKFKGKKDISIISLYHNLDCENNFPMKEYPINAGNPIKVKMPSDGLHPAPAGGNQLGDTLYSYLKYFVNRKK